MNGIKATATETSGRAFFPETWPTLADCPPDNSGELAATAAAVFHAGVMAELLHSRHGWKGPIHYPKHKDYQQADDMLKPRFGRHASGAHSFAQSVALHVLSERWHRVQEVAQHLIEHGHWHSENQNSEVTI